MGKNFSLLLLLVVIFYILWTNTNLKENIYQWRFDQTNPQSPITSQQDIDKIFDQYPTISFSQLDEDFLSKTKYNIPKYKKLVRGSQFLKIKGKDIFKFIVGDFRIKDFLPRDDFYYENIDNLGNGNELLWLIDKQLLYKLLELQHLLVKQGLNETGFEIVNGYRHPQYNEEVGGATLSRHIRGQALDILIGDINDDGRSDQEDKKIVLDLLEKKIIKDKGGVGRYPGTMTVHFDVRGYKARWDQQ